MVWKENVSTVFLRANAPQYGHSTLSGVGKSRLFWSSIYRAFAVRCVHELVRPISRIASNWYSASVQNTGKQPHNYKQQSRWSKWSISSLTWSNAWLSWLYLPTCNLTILKTRSFFALVLSLIIVGGFNPTKKIWVYQPSIPKYYGIKN